MSMTPEELDELKKMMGGQWEQCVVCDAMIPIGRKGFKLKVMGDRVCSSGCAAKRLEELRT